MTWNGTHPMVKLVTKIYQTGVKLSKMAMAEVETKIQRLICLKVNGQQLDLGKWFIDILYQPNLKSV